MTTEAPAPVPTAPSSPAPVAASPSPAAPAPVATAPDSPASTPSPTPSTPTAPSPAAAPTKPDWLPEQFFDAATGPKLDDFGKHFSEIATRDAAEQIRRLSLPQKPEDVKIELPADFPLPQGLEFKIDPTKPEFGKLQAAAIKHGLTQDAVTDLTGIYAETMVGSQAALESAKAAELAQMGPNGTARITYIETALKGAVGEADAKQLMGMVVTAGIAKAMEKIVGKLISQGTAPFSQAHRVAPDDPGIPNYENMSFEQRRHAQDQRATARR